jgi:glycosyltransferase involved in cell wall biosynthesis
MMGSVDQKPTILFVALQTGAGANGGIASMGEIIRALDRYRPVVLTNLENGVAPLRAAGIEVHVVPERASLGIRRAPLAVALTYARYFAAVRRLLRCTGAKIVHANDPLAFQLSLAATKLEQGVRLAFSMRDTLDPERRVPRRRFSWLFGAADHSFFLSHDMRRRWVDLIPEAGLRSSVTYSIVDFARFHPLPLPATGPKVVLVIGVVGPKKGQLRLLQKVVPRLAAAGVETWLTGDFNPDLSDYAAACREVAEPLGEKVKFLGYRWDMPELIAQSHAVCIGSQHEGLMRGMIEAVSMGRPVVSTAVASASEILEEEGRRAGFVFPISVEADMAEPLLRLCGDEALNRELGANGVEIARERFDRVRVVEAYQHVYDRLVDQSV